MEETTVLEKPADTGIDTTGGARVILLNDDYHSFEEVINQLVKAIHCTPQQGESMAWTVHTKGKCEVFHGPVEDCLHVSAVLEEIDLKTQIDFT
ncbi:MAG: ATP-dependent Clp protease adaptor ClpS [Chitinophagales bacterium]